MDENIQNNEVENEVVEQETEGYSSEGVEGIPEDIIDSVLKENGVEKETESAVVPSNDKEVGTDEEVDVQGQKIPYSRFKQKVDEANTLKAQLEEQKKMLEQMKAQMRQAPPTPMPTAQPQQQEYQQDFKFTAEVSQAIENRVNEVAMNMCGFTQDDVDAMEFAEDADTKTAMFEQAKILARQSLISDIRKQAAINLQRQQAYNNALSVGTDEYMRTVAEEQASPDYPAILEYTQNEFFERLSPFNQNILRSSYERVLQNQHTPQDTAIVLAFYRQAKQQFYSMKEQAKPPVAPNRQTIQKKNTSSKFDQIGGTVSTGAVTASTLEDMLDKMPWDKIPEEYRNLMLEG